MMMFTAMLLSCETTNSELILYDDVSVYNGNTTITFDSFTFTYLEFNESYLQIDNLIFDIDCNNTALNMTFVYINPRIEWANERDLILEFTANCSTTVVFNISGLKANVLYEISRDNNPITNLTANEYGNISFSNSIWSNRTFRIIQLDKINYNIRRVTNILIDDYLPIFIVLAGVAGVIALYATNDIRVVLAVLLGLILFAEALKII